MYKKILLLASLVFMPLSNSLAADLIYNPLNIVWNGKKVYLSPATHTNAGARGECTGTAGMGSLNENKAAWRFSYYAASGVYIGSTKRPANRYRNLRTRGYKVRIGRGTVSSAIRNSNSWGATVHIPVHSNAHKRGDCRNNNASRFGTHVIYKSYGSKGGQGLAEKLKQRIGSASPGTNDLICHNSSSCTRINCLGELCSTRAKAAYLEREFHTWNKGAKWMKKDEYNSWRVGHAVDLFLGYPRR